MRLTHARGRHALTAPGGAAVNSLADYSAAGALQAGCTADVRKGLLQSARSSLRRTRSAEWQSEGRALSSLPSRAFEVPRCASHLLSAWRPAAHHCRAGPKCWEVGTLLRI